jgi:hypothetical protein
MSVGDQRHAPAASTPRKFRIPWYRRVSGPQGRYGRVLKISPPSGFDPRSDQPVACRYCDYTILTHYVYASVPLHVYMCERVPALELFRFGNITCRYIRYVIESIWISDIFLPLQGTEVAQCLRYIATNRKVAGSVPDGVIGIFHWDNPSDRTMALGSAQPLTEMSTKRISWGNCGRCVKLTNNNPVLLTWNLGTLTSWNTLGHSSLQRDCFIFTCFFAY